jgi:hypothetical protein
VEEAAAGAAVRFRYFDAHHTELEQFVDEGLGELGMLVHFADERADAGVGELPDTVAEDALVFGQKSQRLREFGGILRHWGVS